MRLGVLDVMPSTMPRRPVRSHASLAPRREYNPRLRNIHLETDAHARATQSGCLTFFLNRAPSPAPFARRRTPAPAQRLERRYDLCECLVPLERAVVLIAAGRARLQLGDSPQNHARADRFSYFFKSVSRGVGSHAREVALELGLADLPPRVLQRQPHAPLPPIARPLALGVPEARPACALSLSL